MSKGGGGGGRFGGGFAGGINTFWSCNKAAAVPHFTQHLRSNPRHFDSLLFRGISYCVLGQGENAVRDFQQAAQVGNGCEKLIATAQLLALQDRRAESIQTLKQATETFPNHGASWFWYGMSVSHAQEQTRAFKRAIDLQYTHAPECHFQLGGQFAAAGNHQEAIRAFRTSLQGNPYRTVCHISLGFSLFHIGQIQEAKSCFEKAVDLNPVLTEANLGLANVYTKEGNKQEAKKHFDIWNKSQGNEKQPEGSAAQQSDSTHMHQASGHTVHSDGVENVTDLMADLNLLPGETTKHGTRILKAYTPLDEPGPLVPKAQYEEGKPRFRHGEHGANYSNFIGPTYWQTTPQGTNLTLYRLYGGDAPEDGQYWSLESQSKEVTRIDQAVLPSWNDMTETTEIIVPPGIILFEGYCRSQGGSAVGGGWQIWIEKNVVRHLIKAKMAVDERGWQTEIDEAKKAQDKFLSEYR